MEVWKKIWSEEDKKMKERIKRDIFLGKTSTEMKKENDRIIEEMDDKAKEDRDEMVE